MARSLARIFLAVLMVAVAAADDPVQEAETAADLVQQVFDGCLQQGSLSCVRPRVLAFLKQAGKGDGAIRITRDLSIVPSGGQHAVMDSNDLDNGVGSQGVDGLLSLPSDAAGRREALRHLLVERMDRFLQSHDLRVTVPRELTADGFVPRAVIDALPKEIRMPLDPEREDDAGSARHRRRRGFLKKVVLPFILGLKFKTTALIPLALSLIALKTWKALTLGLLSLVLSGAMVIFRFTKPKVVNYDVYHYPQSHGHYEHHIDHHAGYDHGHYDHYDHHHSYARSDEPDTVAYRAHQP